MSGMKSGPANDLPRKPLSPLDVNALTYADASAKEREVVEDVKTAWHLGNHVMVAVLKRRTMGLPVDMMAAQAIQSRIAAVMASAHSDLALLADHKSKIEATNPAGSRS